MTQEKSFYNKPTPRVLLVGLGGIGSNLIDLVIPALATCSIEVEIHLMDDDRIESTNLGHQRYSEFEIGKSKVEALAKRHCKFESVEVRAIEEALRRPEQLVGYDVIIVAVDRSQPRDLVHQSGVAWLDLRCQGDGWIILDNNTDSKLISGLPQSEKPTSCQLPGAIENGNIEFGFAAVAALGAQWLFQKLRMLNGEKSQLPTFRMGYLTYGEMNPPQKQVITND